MQKKINETRWHYFSKIRKVVDIKNKIQNHIVYTQAFVLTFTLYFWHKLYYYTVFSNFIAHK